jgi:hypothetical protein
MKPKNQTPQFSGKIWHGPQPCGMSRRDFIQRGLATATLATSVPGFLLNSQAAGAAVTLPTCAPQTRVPGAIAQIYRSGGNTRSAMFFDNTLANIVNSSISLDYGIKGATDLKQVGANYSMAATSPYGMAVMTAPPGYTQTAWNAVLQKTSLGVIYGPFTADDGAGSGLGNLGGASPWKASQLGQDVRINNGDNIVSWGQGLPALTVQNDPGSLSASSVSNLVGLTPGNVLNANQLTTSASTAYTLSSIFSTALGLTTRSGATLAVNKTYCAFSGNALVADPNFAKGAFNPNNISALTSKLTVASLSKEQQCLVGSFYASAVGTCGAVIIEQGGNDYHGNAATDIASTDYEAGQYLQMFLAACDAAGQPGVFIDVSNGNCSCNGKGTTSATITVNGASITTNAPTADGDAGGFFNAAYILCYHPSTPPAFKTGIGTVSTSDGSVNAPSSITSVPAAMAWLYLTALQYVGADVNTAFAQMASLGVLTGTSPSSYILLA